MKTISSVICVLNEAEFVEAAIRSVLPGVDQMIVIDQGSTDGTTMILDHFHLAEPKFTWVSTNGHNFDTRGEQFFRQLEIDLCFSEFLMVTDGDEIMGDRWRDIINPSLEDESVGAIRGRYHQLIGTSEFCAPDSPLVTRPQFLRISDHLHAGPPMSGTKVHVAFEGITPPKIVSLDFDIWHCGYMKTSLTDRFLRNINRGDWTQDEKHKAEFRKAAHAEPTNLLPQCVPLTIPRKRLPASIRTPKFECVYDAGAKRITARKPTGQRTPERPPLATVATEV